jgi:hypothetical protein
MDTTNTTSKPLPPGITPPEPDESLVAQWRTEAPTARDCGRSRELNLVRRAIAWATPLVADQELTASVEFLRKDGSHGSATRLVKHRRCSTRAEKAIKAFDDLIARYRNSPLPIPAELFDIKEALLELEEIEKTTIPLLPLKS